MGTATHARRWCGWRDGLGGDPRLAQDTLQRQRNSGESHARVRRHTLPVAARARAMARPRGVQFSAVKTVRRCGIAAESPRRHTAERRIPARASSRLGRVAFHASQSRRLPDARRRTRAGRRELRRHLGAPHRLAGHAHRRSNRGHRRRQRSGRADRPAAAVDVARLWLRRDHRRLRRPPASAGHSPGESADVASLSRRRGSANGPGPSVRGHGTVPGHAALLSARRGRVHQLHAAPDPARAGARKRPDGRRRLGDLRNLMEHLATLVALTLAAGTPLVLAAVGELLTERSGVLNLGVEGMMLVGAVVAFIVAATTKAPWLGVGAGMVAAASLALVFAVLTLTLMANQVASGLALSLFGVGLSAFIGLDYVSAVVEGIKPLAIPQVSDIPVVGRLLFAHSPFVYLSLALCACVQWFLFHTRAGLIVRAVGESPASAHAIGYSVARIRYLAVLFGGACAGLGGAYMAVAYTPLWTEGMTAGRGWIALALVVFATWKPWRVVAGAYLFGGVTLAQFQAQAMGAAIPSQLLSMLPYAATIVVLALISRDSATIRLNAPASLGRPFHPDA